MLLTAGDLSNSVQSKKIKDNIWYNKIGGHSANVVSVLRPARLQTLLLNNFVISGKLQYIYFLCHKNNLNTESSTLITNLAEVLQPNYLSKSYENSSFEHLHKFWRVVFKNVRYNDSLLFRYYGHFCNFFVTPQIPRYHFYTLL